MAASMAAPPLWALPFLLLLCAAFSCHAAHGMSGHGIGVNYGRVADDIPPPRRSVELLRAAGAGSVKIYDANPGVLRALAGTRLPVSIMVPNEIIPNVAAAAAAADRWVAENLVPYLLETRVKFLLVGNEVLSDTSIATSTWPRLVPAMENLHRSLRARGISSVKIGTTLAMDALADGAFPRPPSAAAFRADIAEAVVRPLLHFLNGTNSYYFVDAYPYFVWSGNNLTVPLDYALFQGGARYVDPVTRLTYTNLLDEMLDAVVVAMAKLGYGHVKLAIAETGWPNGCDYDQIGGNVHNAAIYNRNLAIHMAKNPGTPARPGAKMPVFVFSLYNEDLKAGPGTERHWGLYYANGTAVYEIDLTGRRPLWSYPPLPAPENNTPYKGPIWCVLSAAASKKLNETAVGNALAYACGQGNGTCDAIQPGGKCFLPNTTAAHASYAFNSYWQQLRKIGATCYFNNLAEQTIKNPSHGSCKFRSSLDS
ncbi:probable glucan endo-1,3-beta-glucosidase A6 isoform X2 [Phragmites australis]|uniref:probable glucan endo-1,3-beta-glucosidase A6 isoform X2 n=1 Tax=Phragmites australis TaxID=29695 RepID=UPI002D796A05|nr:probable glucan endo-1,3-beta-glucosidase A6 isoform X2 [Phragmites australis]